MRSYFKQKGRINNAYTVAFYNLENLFDTYNNPLTLDDDFTKTGSKNWNAKRYRKKLNKLSNIIAHIGTEKSYHSPAIVGVAEVENEMVLQDLINTKHLTHKNYGIVHHDSPDERGIDVALLYKKELFEVVHTKSYPLLLVNEEGERDYTRDILMVKGKLNGELMYVLVNHWPSRRSGAAKTEHKRIEAAEQVLNIIDIINYETPEANIIVMGDFNDGPTSKSIKKHLMNHTLFNPMEQLVAKGKGSLQHKKSWYLFDQIIFSKTFLSETPNTHSFKYADVFDKQFLKTWKGKYKGSPFRTFVGKWYKGGVSDHFPVYVHLKRN